MWSSGFRGGEGGGGGGVFFCQAEDGIRDLVRSRGLGDVYKRQDQVLAVHDVAAMEPRPDGRGKGP